MATDEEFNGPNPNPYLELRSGTGTLRDKRLEQAKFFTIPPAMSVMLFGPEIEIVDTSAFQRLAGIKQLGMAHLVYRGATHTRFEHSLGTLHVAQTMIDAIRTNPKRSPAMVPITAQSIRILRLAALLHDLPHIPFGHTLEDEFNVLVRHDENESRLSAFLTDDGPIGSILIDLLGKPEKDILFHTILPSANAAVKAANQEREAKKAAKLSRDEQIAMLPFPFVADIVGNTVCADLLDYTARDMHNTGLVGAIGDRFLSFLTITADERMAVTAGESGEASAAPRSHQERSSKRMAVILDKKGMPRPDVESEIVKLLTYRYELAERVYLHHAKNAASAMLVRAVRALRLHEVDENFHWLSDDLLIELLTHPELAEVVRLGPNSEPLRLKSTSGGSRQFRLKDIPEEAVGLARSLGRAIKERRLYKIAYLGVMSELREQVPALAERFSDPDHRADFEDHLAKVAGAPGGRVLIHCLGEQMMQKEARVRVRTARGAVITLAEWDQQRSGRIDALNRAHVDLWRVAVYAHEDLFESGRAKLVEARMSDELLGVGSAYERSGFRPNAYWKAVWEVEAESKDWPMNSWTWVQRAAADHERSDAMSYEDARSFVEEVVTTRLEGSVDADARSSKSRSQAVQSEPNETLPLDTSE